MERPLAAIAGSDREQAFMRMFVLLGLALTGCAFDPTTRPSGTCGVLADGDGHGATAINALSAGAGAGWLWMTSDSPTTCCNGAPMTGGMDKLAFFDVNALHEGDNEVVPCVTSSSDWPASCESGKVESRYYYAGGMAGGSGTLHLDPPSDDQAGTLSGFVDVTFTDAGKTWRLRSTFKAPTTCIAH